MSITIEQAFTQAAEGLGPVATVLRQREYPTSESFAPFYPILREELENLVARVLDLTDELPLKVDSMAGCWTIACLVKGWVYGGLQPQAPAPVASPTMPTLVVPPGLGQPQIASGPVVAQASTPEVWPNPNGAHACFNKGCGLHFTTFAEAMAHKVLEHNYNSPPKYTPTWAREIAARSGQEQPFGRSAFGSARPARAGRRPRVRDQHAASVEAHAQLGPPRSGLAVGRGKPLRGRDDHDARFYFIRRLRAKTTIKGQFVWTKYAHRFTSFDFYAGNDFVVRKMAGDTKEWIGVQCKGGVANPAYSYKNRNVPAFHYENTYVGSREEDIAEILRDPSAARIKYGHLIGACGFCGRKLTDAVSRGRGIGPDCWEDKHKPFLMGQYSKAGQS